MASDIITFPKTALSRTGRLLGKLGAETSENGQAAQKLAAMSPTETGQKITSLLKSLGVEQRDDYRIVYPESGGFKRELVKRRIVGRALTEDELERLARFLTPPTVAQCEAWLAELSVIAPHRQDGELTGALKVDAYIRRLREYPADIVRHAMLERTWRFFSSWFELEAVLKPEAASRESMFRMAESCKPSEQRDTPPRIEYDAPPKERGPRPFIPEPKAPQPNVEHLREELELLKADKELSASKHGQAYAQSLIERIAQAEARKPTTQEAV
jgi:hypothetical protein